MVHLHIYGALLGLLLLRLTPVLSHKRKVWKDPTANNSPSGAQATEVMGCS